MEFVLLRTIEKTLSILPRPAALALGEMIGNILYISGIYRKIVQINMKHCGYWDDNEIRIIQKKLYQNMGKYMIDFLRKSKTLPKYRTQNYHLVEELLSRNKGIIVLLAHFGNWELLAEIFGKKVNDLNVVAKAMRNDIVDQWLAQKRANTGVTTIYTKQALRKMLEVLKRNGLVAILIDQHAGNQGTPVPFLGKPANTVRTVAGIVQKTDCSVLPTYCIMRQDGSYDVVIGKSEVPVMPEKSSEEMIEHYQRIHNEILSDWIRQYPEHYFGWFHKRFKDQISYK